MTARCPNCNAENPLTAARCQQCNDLLGSVGASHSLEQAEASIQKGDYVAAQAQLDAARPWLESEGASSPPSPILSARYHWLQSLVYYYKEENVAARDELRHALDLLEGKPIDRRLLAEALNTLGNIEYLDSAMDAAADCYKRCAQLSEQIAAHELEAKAWLNLGIVSMSKGHHSEALFVYNKAAHLAEVNRDIAMKVLCYRRMCYIYVQIGPLSRAVEYAERIIDLLSAIPNQNQVCQALVAVAVVYDYIGDFDRSIHYLNRALEIAVASDNKLAWTNTMLKLSQSYWDMDDIEASYKIASELFVDPVTPPLALKELAGLLTDYYVKVGDLTQANYYLNWIIEFSPDRGQAEQTLPYLTFAHLYLAQNDWNQARQHFEWAIKQSKQHSDMHELGRCYLEYGRALLSHDPAAARAREMFTQAAVIFQRIGANHLLVEVNEAFARIELVFQFSVL